MNRRAFFAGMLSLILPATARAERAETDKYFYQLWDERVSAPLSRVVPNPAMIIPRAEGYDVEEQAAEEKAVKRQSRKPVRHSRRRRYRRRRRR